MASYMNQAEVDPTQLLKGVLDLAVLAVLAESDSYGYDVLRRLRENGLDHVGDASVYGTLRRPDQADVLLEDLEDHLREVATDAGGSLAERLGPAEQYAQELRTAYGVAHADATRQHPLLRDVTVAISRVTTSSWYRQVRAFLPE